VKLKKTASIIVCISAVGGRNFGVVLGGWLWYNEYWIFMYAFEKEQQNE